MTRIIDKNKQQQSDANNKESHEIPNNVKQRELINEVWTSKIKVGEYWYVIDNKWWTSWCNYTGFKEEEKKSMDDENNNHNENDVDENNKELKQVPGAIENDAITEVNTPYVLKRGLQENVDYTLVNEQVGDLLYQWYGGDIILKRKVYGYGHFEEARLDLFPVFLNFIWLDEDGKPKTDKSVLLSFKRDKTFEDVLKELKKYDENGELIEKHEEKNEEKKLGEDDEGEGEGENVNTDKIRCWWQGAGDDKDKDAEDDENNKMNNDEDDENNKMNNDEDDENNKMNDDDDENNNIDKKSEQKKKWTVVRGYDLDEQLENFTLKPGTIIWVDQKLSNGKWRKDAIKRNWQDFEVGDIIDAKDTANKWYESTIKKVDKDNQKLYVHFNGWDDKWDEWLDFDSDRLAMQSTHTTGPYKPRRSTYNSYNYGGSGGGGYSYYGGYSGGYGSYSRDTEGAPPEKGAVGLRNLGNTCFMNSTLQCMSNSPHITSYFLNNSYEKEINADNPLGWKGRIAEEYANLLKKLWSGKYTVVSPNDFKRVLGEFQPRFSGYEQQDSSELLNFLLDGLHEDLNLVKKKPYTEAVESDGRPDKIVAKESWDVFRQRNKSVIVNTFQGQFKSTLQCPDCDRISITFDPFRYVSVPLPVNEDDQIQKELTVVFADPEISLLRVKPIVTKVSRISDLLEKVAEMINKPANTLLCADVFVGKIYKVFSDDELVGSIRKNDTVFIYEMNELAKYKPRTYMISYIQQEGCDLPIPFIVPNDGLKASYIYQQILPILKRCVKPNIDINKEAFEISTSTYFTKTIIDISDEDDNEDITLNTRKLSMEWHQRNVYHDELSIEDHPSMSKELELPRSEKALTVQQCLEEYTKAEVLSENDAWYCRVCKKHVQAYKKMELYKIPDILIIHLKRFNFSRDHREKITKCVDFPLENLDMSKYCVGIENGEDAIYNLYAVSNHMGGMGGGHYTAYCKNLEDNKWYCHDDSSVREVSPNNIISSSAYVLFYHKVSAHANPLENGGN